MKRKHRRILLVEVPAVALEMDGDTLGEVVLDHPKYPQLLLAANLCARPESTVDFDVEVLDLKASRPNETQRYKRIDYEGRNINCWRVGASFGALEEKLSNTDIVGISASYTFERSIVFQTIEFIRARSSALIVVGGHDATVDPKCYLDKGADICVLGEGETALYDIAVAATKKDLLSVPGIAFLRNGKLQKNGKRKNHLLDQICFPGAEMMKAIRFHQCPDGPYPLGVDSTIMVLETSRGCNEQCSFCDSSFVVGRYRPIAIQRLLERIEILAQAGIKTVLFSDDNLLYRLLPEHHGEKGREDLLTFFHALFNRGFSWTFYNGLQFGLLERCDTLDVELIETLFKNKFDRGVFKGCFRAYIPLEKFTVEEMSRLAKLRPLEVERAIIAAISRMNVPELNLGFIIGNIRETPDSLKETVGRAREFGELVIRESAGNTRPRFFPWCSVPIPGTPDYKYFRSHIVYSDSAFPELFNNYTSVLCNASYSPLDFTLARLDISTELNCSGNEVHTIALCNS